MNTKEQSVQVIYDPQGEPVAAVVGDRDPAMYSLKRFKKSDYEQFLSEAVRVKTFA